MKSFKEFRIEQKAAAKLPVLDKVYIVGNTIELYEDRKWISGRFNRNIGIDQPSNGVGQVHGHVYGRKDKQLVVVNFDGTASHGTKGRLHADDAAALRARGFSINDDNIVEWNDISGPGDLTFLAESAC